MKTVSGTIRLVQEHRFRLIDENGRDRLFILSHKAPVEWSDLVAMQQGEHSVTVVYSEIDNMLAAEAHDVQLAAAPAEAAQQQQGVFR
jgi:hypothetical protein